MRLRSALYRAARILGDVNAVRRGRLPQRIVRRAVYRQTGRLAAAVSRLILKGR